MGLLLDEGSFQIILGPNWDGSVPVFSGTAINGMITLQDFEVSDEVKKTDVRGAGSKRVRNRYHGAEATFSLKKAVRMAGYDFKTMGGASPVGKWIQITYAPLSTMSTPDVYQGVIRVWKASGSRGEMLLEQLEVDLDVDYGTGA